MRNTHNHSLFANPDTTLLTSMQYIWYRGEHFYKKGLYSLEEESNRYDILSLETDFPFLINSWMSAGMKEMVVTDPYMYHKGELAILYIELYTRLFQGSNYFNTKFNGRSTRFHHRSCDLKYDYDTGTWNVYILKYDTLLDFMSVEFLQIPRAEVLAQSF